MAMARGRRPERLPCRVIHGAAAFALFAAASCTVGPDFEAPKTDSPKDWIGVQESSSPSKLTGDKAELARWWTVLHDPILDSLIERALAGNLSIVQAEALVRQARAQRIIAAAAGIPTLGATGSAGWAQAAGNSSVNSLYQVGFDASWEIDVFGGIRRSVEAATANIHSTIENVRDVRVTLLAEVATTYFTLRTAQGQLAIANQNLVTQRKSLDLTRRRQAAGFVSMLDVANAETQVHNTESRIPTLEITARQSMYALSTLLGLTPDALIKELDPAGPLAALPPSVPTGLPSEILQRRPDIRQSQAQLHQATANVGVAIAQWFPTFSMTGSWGIQAGQVSALGALANQFWSVGPSIQWPLFQGGAIDANIEQEKALVDAALATYKNTVLTALQEVESAMVAFDREQKRTQWLDQSVVSAKEAARLASELYKVGRTDFLNVLAAQRTQLDTESAELDSRMNSLTNLIALYKALGGGWDPGTHEYSEQDTGE
jgi:NodT family efflux transporter outer membrane factor (OMF) lipoprotein